ncbi:3-deoxy-D-manno-octulosonic acid transferase [Rhodoferax sp. GW822-FHT02A01]|uniref:3-deoxy-D-manno-octulosonic acid transferase n=1 Tax=Rhodoferax sp. GW822-FHT02A01 TaxID=3141537 RepID=UPI00315DD263
MILSLYSLAMWMVQPLVRRKLRRRAVDEPRYGHAVEQRFGHYEGVPRPASGGGPLIWVHAVSLGETRAAAVLIEALRQDNPGMRLLLTHGTATGWEQGSSLLKAGDVQVWQPWDTPAAVQRFLRHFQPHVGLLMETEVWPNMVAACVRAKVPLCLVNARMSEQSQRKARRLSWLSGSAFAGLHLVLAQTEEDAARLRALGATVQAVTGNLKFDATPDADKLLRGRRWRAGSDKPVLMFASSREGEEQMLIDALRRQPALPMQWLVVPRHPQRFDAVAELFQSVGFSVSRRSTWADAPQTADVWLGDSLGEMPLYFGLADMALLGGSFAPLGGQNLIEAAACGCPIVMGPHTFNFAQAAEMAEEAGAALRCADLEDALRKALPIVSDGPALERVRHTALAWSQAHRGATRRTLEALRALIGC